MKTVYKWNGGILEERLIDLIDLNGWVLFGWSIEIPEQPIEIPEQASRKRSAANASETTAAA